jgi:hypothetical protein
LGRRRIRLDCSSLTRLLLTIIARLEEGRGPITFVWHIICRGFHSRWASYTRTRK